VADCCAARDFHETRSIGEILTSCIRDTVEIFSKKYRNKNKTFVLAILTFWISSELTAATGY
jgi:hypothetical protein